MSEGLPQPLLHKHLLSAVRQVPLPLQLLRWAQLPASTALGSSTAAAAAAFNMLKTGRCDASVILLQLANDLPG